MQKIGAYIFLVTFFRVNNTFDKWWYVVFAAAIKNDLLDENY